MSARSSQRRGSSASASASAPQPDGCQALVLEIRKLGRLPRRVRGDEPEQVLERNLAYKLRKARAKGLLLQEAEAELAALPEKATDPLQEFRDFGRLPRLVRGSTPEDVRERNLAQKLTKLRNSKSLSHEQEQELPDLGASASASASAPQPDDCQALMLKIRKLGRFT